MAIDFKTIATEKGEQLALGGALLLLIGYSVYAFGIANDADLTLIQGQVTQAEAKMKTNPAPVLAKVDFSATKSAWGEKSVTTPAGARGFVAMFKAKVTPIAKGGGGPIVPTKKDKTLMAPIMAEAEKDLGQVKLKWADGKVGLGKEAATISEYELFRQEAGKGWASLAKTKGTERGYTDTTVEPKKKYAYKVKSRTKDKTEDGKQETEFSGSVEATVPSGVVILYTGGNFTAASVTVRKFIGGQWREHKYTVLPKNEEKNMTGDIGKIEKERDPDTGKMVEVDYKTGFVLNEIKKEKFKFKRTVRTSKIVDGQLETTDSEVDADRDRLKLCYTDDLGKPVELWIADEKEEEPK